MGDDDDEEAPHARGPDEIGVGDTGPQSETTSLMGEDGVAMEGIDLEAAVGRKHTDEKSESSTTEEKKAADEPASSERANSPGAESVSSKREAEDDLEDELVAKKVKEDPSSDGDTQMTLSSEKEPDSSERKEESKPKEGEVKDEATD
jgi:hypothetical protein